MVGSLGKGRPRWAGFEDPWTAVGASGAGRSNTVCIKCGTPIDRDCRKRKPLPEGLVGSHTSPPRKRATQGGRQRDPGHELFESASRGSFLIRYGHARLSCLRRERESSRSEIVIPFRDSRGTRPSEFREHVQVAKCPPSDAGALRRIRERIGK